MAKYDEFPRGQISTIILMCLSDKDKYGYEIIDEVLNKTNGKMSIKQPSLYSSLKRMEEQKLISSYWRDSEIGGKRHYYHLTDLGKKHLEKWQSNFSFENLSQPSASENATQQTHNILQQENLFNISKPNQQNDEKPEISQTPENIVADGQFDLFSSNMNAQIKNTYSLPSSNNNSSQQNSILTSYEKVEDIPSSKKFEYIKKSNRSFTDTVKSINSVEERKYIAKPNTINQTCNQNNFVADNAEPEEKDDSTSNLNSNINQNNLNYEPQQNKINLAELQGYMDNAQTQPNTLEIKAEKEPDADVVKSSVNVKEEIKKDDGVFITERLELSDIPKQPKFEARRFEIYISDNSLSPKIKSNKKETYEDRLRALYEKSKNNAENQELELIDSKIKFSTYKDLQDFYSEQNIKFKPYVKTLYRSNKNFDMIRINKLNMLTSLLMFCAFSLLSCLLGIFLSGVESAMYNTPLTYTIIPCVFLIVFLIRLLSYEKSPQKRIAFDINKFKFNWMIMVLSILLIPLVFSINLLAGFTYSTYTQYAVTLLYPCLLSLVYIAHYLIQKVLCRSKSFYWCKKIVKKSFFKHSKNTKSKQMFDFWCFFVYYKYI